MAITRDSFQGRQVELRQDIHGSKTQVHVDEQTPHDRVSTLVHLTDTVHQNGRHALVHAQEALKQMGKIKDPHASTLKHNVAHALNHVEEMVEHADKLKKHVGKYPGAQAMESELNQKNPSRLPSPMSKIKPKRGSK